MASYFSNNFRKKLYLISRPASSTDDFVVLARAMVSTFVHSKMRPRFFASVFANFASFSASSPRSVWLTWATMILRDNSSLSFTRHFRRNTESGPPETPHTRASPPFKCLRRFSRAFSSASLCLLRGIVGFL